MKLTVVQIITILALFAYLIWEIAITQREMDLSESVPVIHTEYLIIIPVLGILILISLLQFIRGKNKK